MASRALTWLATVVLLLAAPAMAERARPGIIATVGASSGNRAALRGMVRAGMEVARINLSHNDARSARRLAGDIRWAARAEGRTVPILFDLPGGKVRLGKMGSAAVTLRDGDRFDLLPGGHEPTTARAASVSYPALAGHAAVGDRVLLDDGKLELEVTAVGRRALETRVIRGGPLRSKMGMMLKDRELPFPSMTAQDRRKLAIAVRAGASWIGVSMVQSHRNLRAVRRALDRLGARDVKVVAKIESRSALEHLDAIMDAADVVMIARGDLSSAVGADALPQVQAEIARRAAARGKPFIVATNLMSAMQTSDAPSAANRADVARAASQGPGWLMLNETAMSPRPAGIVEALDQLLD